VEVGVPEPATRQIDLSGLDQVTLFGRNDSNLRLLRKRFGVKIVARGDRVTVSGDPAEVENASVVIEQLAEGARKGIVIGEGDVRYAASLVGEEEQSDYDQLRDEEMEYHDLKKVIRPKTVGQQKYVRAMRNYDIVFAIGPAGTGKTYLAMAHAVSSLQRRDVDRILLVRPAVEAGESLGFLPGDYQDKVSPYLRPLYDAMYEMMPAEKIRRRLEMGIIEVAPLAYMRGRTLNNSFVILDEAQNTTLDQMKMFLTRLGFNSKALVTGDITQIDLSKKEESGLVLIQSILESVEGIDFIYLTGRDVVRHRLVQRIIRAFDQHEIQSRKGGAGRRGRRSKR
jgi:phosphate starvation-inducible PhoH-like protein